MDYLAFLGRVIDDGIAAATVDYADDASKRVGSIAGFEACRGKAIRELAQLLRSAAEQSHRAWIAVHEKRISSDEYWKLRCQELEIEWVANCVSVLLWNEGKQPIVPPTARGVMKAAQIVGVQSNSKEEAQ